MRIQRVALFLVLVIVCGVVLHAQNPYSVQTRPVRGFMANMDQLSSPVDHIDPVSGKLHLEIPLASLPQGPGGTGFDLMLIYDSHVWDLSPEPEVPAVPYPWNQNPNFQPSPYYKLTPQMETRAGWAFNINNIGLDLESKPDLPSCLDNDRTRRHRLRVRLLDGSSHIMQLTGWGPEQNDAYTGDGFFAPDPSGHYRCVQPGGNPSDQTLVTEIMTYYSTDGSYLKLEVDPAPSFNASSWRLYFNDGRRIVADVGGLHLFDANGNGIHKINGCWDPGPCTKPYYGVGDDANHEIRISEVGTVLSGITSTVSVKGPHTTSNDDWVSWTLNWEPFQLGVSRDYTMAMPVVEWQAQTNWPLYRTLLGLKNVQLPLASPVASGQTPPVHNSYEIGYATDADNGYGEVDSVRTPTGATFNYRYWLEGAENRTSYEIAHNNSVKSRTVTAPGLSALTWTYTGNGAARVVTNPDSSQTLYYYAPGFYQGSEVYLDPGVLGVGNVVYRIDEPDGTVRKRVWSANRSAPFTENAWVKKETVTTGNSSGTPTLTAITERKIDMNGNALQTKEYDWVPYTASGPEPGTQGTLKRVTDISYYTEVPEAGSGSNPDKGYWKPHVPPSQPGPARRLDAAKRKTVADGSGNIKAVTEFTYDNEFLNGNVTAEKKWDSAKSPGVPGVGQLTSANAQIVTRAYDAGGHGNLTDIQEPRNDPGQEIHTRIAYDSTNSFPVEVDYALNSPEHRVWTYSWNTGAGVLTSKTDSDNGLVTSYVYWPEGRVRSVTEAGQRRTETTYDDANRKVLVKTDLSALGDGMLQTETQYDELGRPALARTRESAQGAWIEARTIYLPVSNVTIKSSPYRTPDSDTEWVCTQTDASKRVILAAAFKGSAAPGNCGAASNRTGAATTVYSAATGVGATMLVTDPAGNVRGEIRDALGRLIEVVEDPSGLAHAAPFNYSTTYNYNALDNLTQVTQGAQTRTFQYTSLGQLQSATNPESGTTTYDYHDSGELKKRTDARGIVTEFAYDPLHRIKDKTYSFDPAGTPAMHYRYYLAGEASPKVGQLRQAYSTLASAAYDAYDNLGRVTASHHSIDGNNTAYYFGYTYFLSGAVESVTNPSGRVISYTVDDAGRTKTVASGGTVYADLTASGSYTPDGRIKQMHLGNNLYESRNYNELLSGPARLTTTFRVGTSATGSEKLKLEYEFSADANNGNVQRQIVTAPGAGHTWTQSFGYDYLNRLTSASEAGGWSQGFGYDRYGNQWLASSSGTGTVDSHELTQPTQINGANNRINYNWYDAAGNQTFFSPFTLDYDAENRMLKARENDGHMSTYLYDGDGRRVRRVVTAGSATTTTYYVHNALGQLALEHSTEAPAAGTTYIHTDMLGTTRLVTDQNGAAVECYDYMPFGRMLTSDVNNRNTGCYPGIWTTRPPANCRRSSPAKNAIPKRGSISLAHGTTRERRGGG